MRALTYSIWQIVTVLILSLSTSFAQASSAPFGFTELDALLTSARPKTPDELLRLLPDSLRANHLLLHHTESQDQATQKFPRIVLFNEDASLLMAFSGSEGHRRGDFVEVIRYDADTHEFEPIEIDFTNKADPKLRHRPQECYSCHGPKQFRPIWRAYDTWPGAFGVRHVEKGRPSIRDAWAYGVFRSQKNREGRERFSALPLPSTVSVLAQRNSDFTSLLALKNVDRVAHLILKQIGEDPSQLVPVLVALKEGEDQQFEQALPAELAETYRQTRAAIAKEVQDQLMSDFNEKTSLTHRLHGSTWPFPKKATPFELYYYRSVVMLRFLELNSALGPLDEWPTTLRGRQFEFTLPFGIFYEKLATRILRSLKEPHPIKATLQKLEIETNPTFFDHNPCSDLLSPTS